MRIRITIALLVIALIAGIGSMISSYLTTKMVGGYEKQLQTLNNINHGYQTVTAAYKKRSDSLEVRLRNSDSLLAIAKAKSNVVKERIIVKMIPSKSISQKAKTVNEKLSDCDSLKSLVQQFMDIQSEKEGIQSSIDSSTTTLMDLKDSQIQLCDTAYNQMITELKTSIAINEQCVKENEALQAKLKRKTFWQKFTGSAAILTAAALGVALITR